MSRSVTEALVKVGMKNVSDVAIFFAKFDFLLRIGELRERALR